MKLFEKTFFILIGLLVGFTLYFILDIIFTPIEKGYHNYETIYDFWDKTHDGVKGIIY